MAGGIDWFRWHHGSASDRKFPLVAKRAGARVGDVITMWAMLLEQASASDDRGNPGNIDFESIDLFLGMEDGTALAIHAAMVDRDLIDLNSGRLVAWERRQPKRERPEDNSTERSRNHRAKQRNATPSNATQRQTPPEEQGDTPAPAPPPVPTPTPPPVPAPAKSKGYSDEFEAAWAIYPARPGNSKADAFKAWNARLAAGATAEQLTDGTRRYADFVAASKTEPRFVKQAATFFGPGDHYLADWTPPAPAKAPPPAQSFAERAAEDQRSQVAAWSGGLLGRPKRTPVVLEMEDGSDD